MSLCALGGGRLEGTNVGRFVYLDEAGTSNEASEPWLTVGGLLIHADTQLNKVYQGIAKIERMMPTKDREEGLVLHPAFIYGGNGRFDTKRHPEWTVELRRSILRELAELPNRANILVTCAPIRRASLPPDVQFQYVMGTGKGRQEKVERNRTYLAQAIAYMACLLECDLYLREHAKGENCMVIAEDVPKAKEAIRYIHRYHQDPDSPFPEHLKRQFPLSRIREDPAFQEKRQGNPLILADFIAFVTKRQIMKDPNVDDLFAPWARRIAQAHVTEPNLGLR